MKLHGLICHLYNIIWFMVVCVLILKYYNSGIQRQMSCLDLLKPLISTLLGLQRAEQPSVVCLASLISSGNMDWCRYERSWGVKGRRNANIQWYELLVVQSLLFGAYWHYEMDWHFKYLQCSARLNVVISEPQTSSSPPSKSCMAISSGAQQ